MAAIAKFTNGRLRKESADKLAFGMFEEEKTSNSGYKRRKLVAETSHMTYVGDNNIKEGSAPHNKYMLAVRDKATGKIQVYDSDVFHMRPYFPGEEVEKESNEKGDMSFIEKSNKLTMEFGSSKKQRAIKSRLKSQILPEELEQALSSAADTALNMSGVTEIQKEIEAASAIPPYDINATDPAKVYNLNDIISAGEQAVLEDSARTFIDCTREQIAEWEANNTYPVYILEHLRILPVSEAPRKEQASLLMYLSYMFKLFHLKVSELRQKDPFPKEVPNMIKQKLLKTYAVRIGGRFAMPARLKDKLMSYMIVLCLFIDEFYMSLHTLQIDLKCGEKKLLQFCSALGCKHTSSRGEADMVFRTTKLVVPLTFPQTRQRKAKKSRT